jgi:hypothetical protein
MDIDNSINEFGKIFLVFDGKNTPSSGVNRDQFFALLSSMFSDVVSLDSADLDKLMISFANPEVLSVVNALLERVEASDLDGMGFSDLVRELLSGLPTDIVGAIGDWLDMLGTEDIMDRTILFKLLTLILVMVVMVLKMQIETMEAIFGVKVEVEL